MKQGNRLIGLVCLCFLLLLSACGPGSFNTAQTTTLTPPPYVPFPTLYRVQALSQQSVWAVGGQFDMQGKPTGGTIVHYDGQQWVSTAVASPLFGISMLSPNNGWAVGFNGTILHYDGHSWSAFNSPTSAVLRSVVMTSASNGWAVGYGGTLLHYDGHAWKAQNSSTTANLYSIAMYTDSSLMASKIEGWAVGASGTLLHYAKGSWTTMTAPSANTLYDVFMLSAQQVWAVGQNGTVIQYDGTSWTPVTSPFKSDIFGVSLSSPNEGWVSGDAIIMHYTKGALVVLNSNMYQAAGPTESVSMLSAQEGWAVGMNNVVSAYHNGTWKIVYGTAPTNASA